MFPVYCAVIEGKLFRHTPAVTIFIFGWLLVGSASIVEQQEHGKQCSLADFRYEYTKCDKYDRRWRVAVPKDDAQECDQGIPSPQRGVKCSFYCGRGQFLDINTQQCRMCPKGFYSLGGGIRFDSFSNFPDGFILENYEISTDGYLLSQGSSGCPPKRGWIIRNGNIVYVPTPCFSKITYTAKLVRLGYLDYTYRMPRNNHGIVFKVEIKDNQRRTYWEEIKRFTRGGTRRQNKQNGSDWLVERIKLTNGPSIITWSIISSRRESSNTDTVSISRIDIIGTEAVQKCSICPAGTFGTEKRTECKPCSPGFYSPPGSPQCLRCPSEQFSRARAASCIERPACTERDYYPVLEPCHFGKTRNIYVKVSPSVCRDDTPGAVKIPEPSVEIPCPRCNPGMSLDATGNCSVCPKNHYSQGDECLRCPIDTLPNYGYHYIIWNSLPPTMFTKCEYIIEGDSVECLIGNAWIPFGNKIQTSPTHETGVALELGIRIADGFSNPLLSLDESITARNPLAQITFDFETKCSDESCTLYFIEDLITQSFYRLITDFSGTQSYRTYTHPIVSAEPTQYMFIFVRSRSSLQEDVITDRAMIYRINVTNVADRLAGASACVQCPKSNGKCVQCLAGEYISLPENKCKRCPNGLVLNTTSDRMGPRSCIECGENLASNDSVHCSSDGFPRIFDDRTNKTYQFNFTFFVNKFFIANGVKVFTREGSSYYHTYNISLFDDSGAECKETYKTSENGQDFYEIEENPSVKAHICRSTTMPFLTSDNSTQPQLSLSPVIIGDKLLAIRHDVNNTEFIIQADNSTDGTKSGSDTGSNSMNVHFIYGSSASPTQVCPHGVFAVVTMQCDSHQNGQMKVRLPEHCPDGTCDGCFYQIIVQSSYSCPICTEKDYTIIRGECVGGLQSVHRIPGSYCIMKEESNLKRMEKCSTLTPHVQLLFLGAVIILITLFIIIIMVQRKNRSLEYKYMKLIEWKDAASETKMAGAETCGVTENGTEDDNEDHERVFFGKKKRRNNRGYRKDRVSLSGSNGDDGGRTPFVALEETD